MPPTSSITCAAEATSARPRLARSRSSSWQPTDIADVTGPGTTITCRPSWRARSAVACAPERAAASTTTVPRVSAAISRLRTRNRCSQRRAPRRPLADQQAALGDPVEQRAVCRRIGPVHAAGQHRDRRRLRRPGRRGARRRRCRRRRRTRPSSPARPAGSRARRRRARRRRWRPATRRRPPTGRPARRAAPARAPTARPAGPGASVRSDWSRWSAGSAAGRQSGRAAAAPATRRPRGSPAARRSARPARRSARLSSCSARAPTSAADACRRACRRASSARRRPARRRSTNRQKSIVPGSATRLSQARARRTRMRLAGAGRPPRGPRRALMPPPAAAACRAPRRRRRRPGTRGRPGRRRVQATRSTRSKPRTVSAPRSSARSASRSDAARHRPALPQQPARASGCSPTSPVPASRCGRGGPGRRHPARRRRPWSPVRSSPSSQAARVTAGRSTCRSIRSSSGPGQPRLVAPPLQRAARAGGVAGRAWRTGTGWRPAPAGPGTGRWPTPRPGGW